MIVFKTILKILYKIKGVLILYTAILVGITLLAQTSGGTVANFEEAKPDILIINEDTDNEVTKGFVEYIENHAEKKEIDLEDEEKINDAIFYRDINYIIYIPKNYGEELIAGKNPSLQYKSTGDEFASYSEMMVDKYIGTVLVYKDYYSGEELNKKVAEVVDTDTEIELKTTLDTSKMNNMVRYFNFLNYAFLAGCVYCMSMILASINEEKVKRRTIISSYDYKKYNRIVLLSNAIMMAALWAVYMGIAFILFGDSMLTTNGELFMFNSFIFMICSLSVGLLIGTITTNKNAVGGIVNVVALGTSFLCGCFVPFAYMPEYVINLAHAFPTYYFVTNNEMVKSMENFDLDTLRPYLINIGIVLGFSLAFVLIANYIARRNRQKKG